MNVPDPVSVKQESIKVETIDPEEAANDEQAPPFSVSESSIKEEIRNEIDDESISTNTNNILLTNMQENTKLMQASLKEIQQSNKELMMAFAEAMANESKMKNDVDNWSHKLVLQESASDFDPIPKPISEDNLRRWYVAITNKLGRSPWLMEDGSLVTIPIPEGSIAKCNASYKLRSTRLAMILTQLLKDAKMDDTERCLEHQFATSNGMLILNAIQDAVLPISGLKILNLLTELGGCVHKNKETVTLGLDQVNHILNRIKDLGYETIDDLRVVYAQRFFLHGAYSDTDALKMIQDCLKNKLIELSSWRCPNEFGKEIQVCFENFDIYKDGEMISLPANAVGGISRRVSGQSTEDGSNMIHSGNTPFQPCVRR